MMIERPGCCCASSPDPGCAILKPHTCSALSCLLPASAATLGAQSFLSACVQAYIGPPSIAARHDILRSCCVELSRVGILAGEFSSAASLGG